MIDAFFINVLNVMKTNEVYFHPCDRSNTEKLYRGETVEQSFLEKVSYVLIFFYCIMYSSFDRYIFIQIVDSEAFFTFCCLEYSVRRYHYVGIVSNVSFI